MTDFVSAPFYDLFHESWYVPKLRRSLSSLLAGAKRSILEVGAGTGLVTASLADWTPAEIFALEPSATMRAVLLSRLSSRPDLLSRVTVLSGDALSLRLDDRSTSPQMESEALRVIGTQPYGISPERPDVHRPCDQMTTKVAARCPRHVRPDVHRSLSAVDTAVVDQTPDLVPRKASTLIAEALADTRVVTLNGARQAGKSTLARLAASASPDAVVRLLDDPATLRAAQDDPADFVEHDGLMVIDEVQLAPELFRSIKVVVDTDPRPGRFLLTGSAQVLALRQLPDALPGRMEIIELWPFSQGEIDHSPDAFIDAAFAHGPALSRTSALRKRNYLDRLVRGGYPEAIRRTPRRRAAFFDSYLTSLIERDVKELAAIERSGDLRRLLALLAGRSGTLLVPAALASESGIPRTTLNRYLELLTAVFLIKQIPAWSSGQTQRATGTPKLAFTDTGIAAHLIGQDAARLGDPDGAAGPMIETFVLMELARQLTWSSERARLYHYRTKDKIEVDAVLETPDGRLIAIEVKAGATVRAEDLAGLRHLADRVGTRLVAGYVLYTGQQTLPFGDRLRALPLDALWQATP